ncbi:MAG: tetratricopeptide repeat protein [Candidatus Kapabacteria bacterium]|nr:tetratricopeptide repeat protein [Candidatus Kapabacteria bacterium]
MIRFVLTVLLCMVCVQVSKSQDKNNAYKKLQEGKFKEAIPLFTTLIKSQPNDAQLHYARGFALYQVREYEKSLVDVVNACELKPDFIEAIFLYANLKYMTKDYKGSVAQLDKALLLDSINVQALTMRGELRCSLKGDLDGGCNDLKKASALGSDAANQAYNKYCIQGQKPNKEMFGLNFPPEEKWSVADRQETQGQLSLFFLREGEDLQNWKQIVHMLQMQNVSKDSDLSLDTVENIFILQAKKNSPKAKVTKLSSGMISNRKYKMFTVETQGSENEKVKESTLFFIVQGNNDLYACSRSIKLGTIPKDILEEWIRFFKETIIKDAE